MRNAENIEQKAKRFAENLENTFQSNEGDDVEEWDDIHEGEMEVIAVIDKKSKRR